MSALGMEECTFQFSGDSISLDKLASGESSCRLQFQPCSNTTFCYFQVTLNTLISLLRSLIEVGCSFSGAGSETPELEHRLFLIGFRTSSNVVFLQM